MQKRPSNRLGKCQMGLQGQRLKFPCVLPLSLSMACFIVLWWRHMNLWPLHLQVWGLPVSLSDSTRQVIVWQPWGHCRPFWIFGGGGESVSFYQHMRLFNSPFMIQTSKPFETAQERHRIWSLTGNFSHWWFLVPPKSWFPCKNMSPLVEFQSF